MAAWEQLKSVTKQVAGRYGLTVDRTGVYWPATPLRVGGLTYAQVRPVATYSPWRSDPDFTAFMEYVRPNTLVDELRCWELWQLVPQLLHVPGSILEVGVWRGGTGAILAKRAEGSGKSVFLCDTFEGVVKTSAEDSSYNGGEHADTSVAIVETLLRKTGLHADIVKGIFPDDCLERMKDEQFCFVHVDVDVYRSAQEVVSYVWPKMPLGAVLVFDDYGFETCDGIARLVDAYRPRPDMHVIHNLNGHAIVVKIA